MQNKQAEARNKRPFKKSRIALCRDASKTRAQTLNVVGRWCAAIAAQSAELQSHHR